VDVDDGLWMGAGAEESEGERGFAMAICERQCGVIPVYVWEGEDAVVAPGH